jgi:UDP-glucuronate 4-epimerase
LQPPAGLRRRNNPACNSKRSLKSLRGGANGGCSMKILVTGNAGFIGFHVAKSLIKRGEDVVGFDAVNTYYDPTLKEARLKQLEQAALASDGTYSFIRANLASMADVESCFATHRFDRVIHLAAQAGVRYSVSHPHDYVQSNLVAFTHILEACRHARVPHLTYASTSSVYGANTTTPFSEHQGVSHPLQFYAATKRANELMAHAYSHMFRLPVTGLRFFTVYGPWGRPDMAFFLFTKNILEGKPIQVFNYGKHTRDFTYIDDITEAVVRISDKIAEPDPGWCANSPDPASSNAPFKIYNIGNNSPVTLDAYIEAIEHATGRKALKELLPLQPGDVPDTCADIGALAAAINYRPATPVPAGIARFVAWYRDYYQV